MICEFRGAQVKASLKAYNHHNINPQVKLNTLCLQETPSFRGWGGSWDTPYGRFFLAW